MTPQGWAGFVIVIFLGELGWCEHQRPETSGPALGWGKFLGWADLGSAARMARHEWLGTWLGRAKFVGWAELG